MTADDRKAHLCVRCRERPRLGALTRCKPCLQADAAAQVGGNHGISRVAKIGEKKTALG